MTNPIFSGSLTALVTPFTANNALDEKAFADFVEWQISEGTTGLIPVGTTGESPTLTHEEHKRVVELTVDVSAGRVPVMAGAGSNNTAAAIEFAEYAAEVGADGVLVVTPYYNKPSQHGLYAHFSAVAKATDLPLIIYNIPSRSIVDMSVETMARLAHDHETIVGVKDATGQIERVSAQRAACGEDFIQLSGNDDSALGFLAHGGHGCISVSANVAPRLCADFQQAWADGEVEKARSLFDSLFPLHNALFDEPNPAAAKYALSLMGRMENHQRLPLVDLQDETKQTVRKLLSDMDLLG